MKLILRALALTLFLAAIGYWLAAGANRGWNKNQVQIKTVDEVTGIEGVSYQKKFVPGAEFLAVAVAISIALAGSSFLFRTKRGP